MNYTECLEYIEEVKVYGSVLGLESMIHLLNELDNPQNDLKFVHVAGTNGKGSTAAFIASILGVSLYRVGRYISPSVISYEEKIQVTTYNSENLSTSFITKEELGIYLEKVKEAVEAMVYKGYSHPTLFEIETALSFLYFKEMRCDLVVLEVGLGGRLDATNVIETVLCSVITSISMDHMEFLGDTIEKIAYEKAGIIKLRIPVVSYEQDLLVSEVLKLTAKKQGSTYHEVENKLIEIGKTDCSGSKFTYGRYKDCEIMLVGLHQIKNSILAILAVEELIKQGYHISYQDILLGLKETKWKGRFEIISKEPYFVIDGAHNEDAAIVLANNIREYFTNRRIIYIMGVLKDKDYKQLVRHTASLAAVIITITPNNARGLSSAILAEELVGYCDNIYHAETVKVAVEMAYQMATNEDVIIAFGSLSYLYEIYKLIEN